MTRLLTLAAAIERGEAPLFRAEFTMPPSVNAAYGNVARRLPDDGGRHKQRRGRGKTEEAYKWQETALKELLVVRRPWEPLRGRVCAVYAIRLGDGRKRDCANYEKLASDMLVRAGILQDDSQIMCNVQQFGDVPQGRMLAEIYGAE